MYRFVASLLEPLSFGFLCAMAAAALLWRKRRGRRRRLAWMTAILLVLALSCTNLIGHPAVKSLEWRYPPASALPKSAEAIVVLASGVRVEQGEEDHVELDADSAIRCMHAAEVYHRAGPCPVIASGGKASSATPGPPVAEPMRDFLIKMGVAPSDVIVEGKSRTTFENAVESRQLLEQRNLDQIVLVTDAAHMFRSARCFRALGIKVTPAACNYRAVMFRWSPCTFLPTPEAARKVQVAFHEWLGIVWYWLHGRI